LLAAITISAVAIVAITISAVIRVTGGRKDKARQGESEDDQCAFRHVSVSFRTSGRERTPLEFALSRG